MAYIRIIKACIGIEKDRMSSVVSKWFLYEGENFETDRVYNYYAEDNEYWNTEHPVITLVFEDAPTFILRYEIPPECYIYIARPDSISLTLFRESDLVEREETIIGNDLVIQTAVNFILEKYLEVFNSELKDYQWKKKDENM